MKKLLTFTLILLLAGSTSFFSSCGTKGDPGADGPQGNANVNAFTFTVASWTNGISAVVPDNDITQDIVDNGFVQAYAATDADNTIWAPLPYDDGSGIYSFNYETGDIEIDYAPAGNVGASTRQEFKVIAVAGSIRKMMQQQNVNIKDYPAVQHFLIANNIKQQTSQLPVNVQAAQIKTGHNN